MKNMKKTAYFVLIAVMATLLVSCGKKNEANNDEIIAEIVNEDTQDTSISEEGNAVNAEETDVMLEKETEEIVPIIRDSMEKEGFFAGCAVTGSEIDDEKVWEIITTHFNAVTLGNELKPDCMFGYSNSSCPGTEVVELNGEELIVPKLSHARADKILDKIVSWNEENPDKQIKVRGHVLVWHSQTPEWFFHEDYKKSNPYVDKETMNKRLEWYISSVLSYYTGEDSKYKDLFYGWDVVNEAISDKGGIRTDSENDSEKLSNDTHGSNSSWYHIYQSNEFIINAFKYANKYAPADLELYYNDYNECDLVKQNSILELLTAIKEAEGEPGVGTRISGMGMQGHYGMESPDPQRVARSIKNYSNIVGEVQITEMDISASSSYDGSSEKKEDENEKLRLRYNMLYFNIKTAAKEEGVDFRGITFWGTVDHYSWLQSRSNVGGGNTTGLPQMPLLFDENYLPKPCFYVFAKAE